MTTEKRQRIEGALHRSLPATLTIRAADDGQADDGLLRLRLSPPEHPHVGQTNPTKKNRNPCRIRASVFFRPTVPNTKPR